VTIISVFQCQCRASLRVSPHGRHLHRVFDVQRVYLVDGNRTVHVAQRGSGLSWESMRAGRLRALCGTAWAQGHGEASQVYK
jgi:hypothetical protein